MKTRRTTKLLESENFHFFVYGFPGSGKTKFIGDFHKAGQNVVLVTDEQGEMTLAIEGLDIPILVPETEDEIRAIIEQPEAVTEGLIHKMPGFEEYEPKCWAFDNIRTLQQTIFGELGDPKARDVLDGIVTLPKTPDTGVMAMPVKRADVGTPSPTDYRIMEMKTRGMIKKIEDMKYHTIITAHAEKNFSVETHMKLTGDPKKDKDVTKTIAGWPSIEGWSLKTDVGGLGSDFFVYLEGDGTSFYMYPKPAKGFHARTRLAKHMPSSLVWTNANAFEIFKKKFDLAKKKG
jgi:hypothetical protein